MIADPRTKAKLHGFFHHWLELERAESISKDPKAFPDFNAAVLADLRTSLELFLDEVVWSEQSDYRELLHADYLYLNERLGEALRQERHGRRLPARVVRPEAARGRGHAPVPAGGVRATASRRRRSTAASSSRATSSA